MKTRTTMAVSAALFLTACVSSLAWKSVITGANLNSAALPLAADSTSNTYQLFSVGTQLYLRKLDPKGVEV